MHAEQDGAYTGEVSPPMLVELGVDAVVLGHSERRQYYCETDRALQDKVPAALEAGLQPIFCVGETEDERESGETQRKLRNQVQEGLESVPDDRLADVVIAYEPIWAIGTGVVATPAQAQEAIAFVRALVGDRSTEAAAAVRVLYGGSVKPDNAPEILAEADVDGALVGGASLDPESFARIVARRSGMTLPPGPSRPPVPAVCLVVLDGWGLADPGPGNAVELARTPVFDELWATYEHATLRACGPAVGLPEGQMGNSEVGHLNLGAGAVVKQDLVRIDEAIESGAFFENEVLRGACRTRRLHLLGLVSGGGVHSSLGHLRACVELAAREGVEEVLLHAFTDGRDTLPDSGAGYVARGGGLASGARRAGGHGDGPLLRHGPRPPLRAHRACLRRRWPTARRSTRRRRVRPRSGPPTSAARRTSSSSRRSWAARGAIRDGDGVLCFNFRPDRARQLTQMLDERLDVSIATLTEYQEAWSFPVAFPPAPPGATLSATLAERGIRQLHVAETEKYAHVTYFFNGGEEDPPPGEERCLVDSPRDVPTYDHKPEMSARGRRRRLRGALAGRRLRLRDHQLRQPGHGGPHRRDPGRGEGSRDGGRVPGAGRGGGAREGRRLHRDGGPRQRRPHARARRQPEHRALPQSRADRDHGRGGAPARGRRAGRRGADRPGPVGGGAARRDDRKTAHKT